MAKRYRSRKKEGTYAFQWQGDWTPLREWLDEVYGGKFILEVFHRPGIIRTGDTLQLSTVLGTDTAKIGDWIVPDVEYNRFYKISEKDFEAYEEV